MFNYIENQNFLSKKIFEKNKNYMINIYIYIEILEGKILLKDYLILLIQIK